MNANNVNFVKLGDYIDFCDDRNSNSEYLIKDVRGISIEKKLIYTKADMQNVSLLPYKLLRPKEFCYVTVTSRNGGKISLAMNEDDNTYILSSSYIVFKCKDTNVLLPEYLYMFLSRSEFDRYSRFNSWGSARETFDWDDLCRVQIPLPPIEIQQELVDTYKGLKLLAEQNEALIEPLSKTCEAFIVDCRTKYKKEKIDPYIEETKEINYLQEYGINQACGVNTKKEIQDAKRIGDNLKTYKIIHNDDIVFNMNIKMSSLGEKFAVALNKRGDKIVSNFYVTLKVINRAKLSPEYLIMWLEREDFARYVKFVSCKSVRECFTYEDLSEVEIPIPPIEIQQSIVNIYNCLEEAKSIAVDARYKLKDLCPALIQMAINS